MVVPEQTRTDDAARIGGQIRPAVAVDIGALLAVAAGQQRQPPVRRDGRRVPEHAIGGAARRSVHEGLPLDLLPRTLRDEIDDAAHRPGPVKRRRDAFDDFDLREVGRRNLQQAERAGLLAEERQPVGEEARVASSHALNPHARRAERGRRRLDPQAAHFVEHHHDVARRHHDFFLDLVGVENLDAHRLILDPLVGSRGGDRDVFFDRRLRAKRDRDRAWFAGANVDRDRLGFEPFLGHDDLHRSGRHVERRATYRIGAVRRAVRDDRRIGDRAGVAAHFDLQHDVLRQRAGEHQGDTHTDTHDPASIGESAESC